MTDQASHHQSQLVKALEGATVCKEFVLPSGKFATARKPIVWDLVCAFDANAMAMMVHLCSHLIKLDGELLDDDAWLAMSVEDVAVCLNVVKVLLSAIDLKSTGIA